MNRSEASKLAREAIKLAGARGKVKYTTRESLSFDFIVNFQEYDENDNCFYKFAKAIKEACDKLGLVAYTDPTNDIMTDYFGCNNSMVDYNGTNIKWAAERS
jgi:hypothetical protein